MPTLKAQLNVELVKLLVPLRKSWFILFHTLTLETSDQNSFKSCPRLPIFNGLEIASASKPECWIVLFGWELLQNFLIKIFSTSPKKKKLSEDWFAGQTPGEWSLEYDFCQQFIAISCVSIKSTAYFESKPYEIKSKISFKYVKLSRKFNTK